MNWTGWKLSTLLPDGWTDDMLWDATRQTLNAPLSQVQEPAKDRWVYEADIPNPPLGKIRWKVIRIPTNDVVMRTLDDASLRAAVDEDNLRRLHALARAPDNQGLAEQLLARLWAKPAPHGRAEARLSWRPGRMRKRNHVWRSETSPRHVQCLAVRYAT